MDNSGGAKPKTATGVNNNGNNSQQVGSSSSTQTVGAQPRRRSLGVEAAYNPLFSRVPRNVRNYSGSTPNTYASRHMADEPTNRRTGGLLPTSRARHSSSTQTRYSTPQRVSFSEYSPLRGADRRESRNLHWQNGNVEFRRRPPRYLNPVPTLRDTVQFGPLESPTGDVLPPLSCHCPQTPDYTFESPNLHGILSSSEDSDSESGSPVSPPESSQLPSPASTDSLALPQASGEHPVGMSRDAVLARELLQSEMDMMMQRDEEMARQLQDEVSDDDSDYNLLHPPANRSPFLGSRAPPRRFRHRLPTINRRQDAGFRQSSGPEFSPSLLRFMLPEHQGIAESDPNMFRQAIQLLGVGTPRGVESPSPRRGSQTTVDDLSQRLRRRSSDVRNGPGTGAFAELETDDHLVTVGLEPPADDFLSMMNDPSLMLLMLLLRAPGSMYENEAGVDLEDYEALWDLAEQLGEVRRRGISEEAINSLPTQKFKSQSEQPSEAAAMEPGTVQCQICLVDFENGDCLRCIPCKHDFHKDCIDEWLKRNATCPICRQDIRPSAGDK